jgi:ABC-type bacteriocin/lantibiotic exporter with double-glycine peptidase domain
LFYLDVVNQATRSLPGLILIAVGLVALFPSGGFFHALSVVYFFTVTTMLMRVLASLGTAVASGGRAAIDIRAAFDLDDILGHPTRPTARTGGTMVSSVRSITFNNLSCGYVSGQPVLTDFSGALHATRCYAFVGRSGSGKSTLSDVLLGHLAPLSGRLRIDGVPYEQIDMESLRRRVVLVEQQTRIFSGTVRENIAFGSSPSDAEIQLAIRVAALKEFIASLPAGLETQLDYQGANLSGGQRQRIGLARAIVRRPDVLILDEATSALDPQTRDSVVKDLRELFKGGILVFITHDNSVIKAVDEVWHIKKGSLMIELRDAVA